MANNDGWVADGEYLVFTETTRKPFERFKVDATQGLMQGLSGLATTHQWRGTTAHVNSLIAEGEVIYDHGTVTCRIRFQPYYKTLLIPFYEVPVFGPWLRTKVLNDVKVVTQQICETIQTTGNRDVFIVHGHDENSKLELMALLGESGLRPIVLSEQDARGFTIIESFEHYASQCAFAFVIMTPDDRTKADVSDDDKMRARQNVILELGWFISRLGRQRVVILYKDQLEIPSDVHGVIYLRFENSLSEIRDKIRQRLKGVQLIS